MASYSIGDRVKIAAENDNENYDGFRDTVLVITDAEVGGWGYDSGMYPELLMCFETEDGKEVPFSLYEYEIVKLYKAVKSNGCLLGAKNIPISW